VSFLSAELLGPDLIIVLIVVGVILIFGGTKIPKLARSLGSAQKEFKKGLDEGAGEAGADGAAASQTSSATPAPPAAIPPASVTPPAPSTEATETKA
jgi:sec-independent protein translocase protein TatA